MSAECDLVNANNQLSAFVIQQQRHLAIVSLSCFCATNPKQMNVCMVLTMHTVPRIEAGTIAQLLSFIPYFVRSQVVLGMLLKCSPCAIRFRSARMQDLFFYAQVCDSLGSFSHVSMLLCLFLCPHSHSLQCRSVTFLCGSTCVFTVSLPLWSD